MSIINATDSNNVSGSEMIRNIAANAACGALVGTPSMRAGTPELPSRPGSMLAQGLPWSVSSTHPLSRAATPLTTVVNNTAVISGPSAPLRQTSQPQRLESATARPYLLLQSSQSSGSQPEPINQTSQVSNSSQIHGMTLKYSNDEITDDKLRELNLQTAAQQYMMESDAQQKTTPLPFQKNQSPPRQMSVTDHYIPDGQNT